MKDIDGQEIRVGDLIQIVDYKAGPSDVGLIGKVTEIMTKACWVKYQGHYEVETHTFNSHEIFCLFYRKPTV